MIRVRFRCTACDAVSQVRLGGGDQPLRCGNCGRELPLAAGASTPDGLASCLVCGCPDLFVRKDFSQRVGVGIVVVGFAASAVTWGNHLVYATYGILFATALIDLLLYGFVGNLLQCYRCQAEYRGLPELVGHRPFNLETHERYRQQVARLAEQAAAPRSQP